LSIVIADVQDPIPVALAAYILLLLSLKNLSRFIGVAKVSSSYHPGKFI